MTQPYYTQIIPACARCGAPIYAPNEVTTTSQFICRTCWYQLRAKAEETDK